MTRKLSSREHCKCLVTAHKQSQYQLQGADETIRVLFSRALAELKYLNTIKNSRKKTDHLAKLLWKGL